MPGESCATELLDHRAEEPVGNSQVEQDIRRIVLPLPLLEDPSESTKSFRFREISPQIFHSLREPGPRLLIDCASSGAQEGLQHLREAIAPSLGGLVCNIDADDCELVRKPAGAHEIVERRHDETLSQIASSAKDRDDRWRCPAIGSGHCGCDRGLRSDGVCLTHYYCLANSSRGLAPRAEARGIDGD